MANEETTGETRKRPGPKPRPDERQDRVIAVRFTPAALAGLEAALAHQRAQLPEGVEFTAAHLFRMLLARHLRELGLGPDGAPAAASGASTPLPPAAVAPEPEPAPPSAPEESPAPPPVKPGEGDDGELRDAALTYQARSGKEWIEIAAAIGWDGSALSSWARSKPVNRRGTLRAISPERRAALVKLLGRAKK